MSVYLTVTWADGSKEDCQLASQREAENVWPEIGRRHGFELITGIYPMSILPEDLDTWTREITVLRDELPNQLPLTAEQAEMWSDKMNNFLDVLERLKNSEGWDADIG